MAEEKEERKIFGEGKYLLLEEKKKGESICGRTILLCGGEEGQRIKRAKYREERQICAGGRVEGSSSGPCGNKKIQQMFT